MARNKILKPEMLEKPTPKVSKLKGRKLGDNPKIIDWELFEELCKLQCTQAEIAGILKIHPNTLSDRVITEYKETYADVFERFSAPGKTSLRRYQFIMAQSNPAMAIWLGKIWLGQRDVAHEETNALMRDLRDAIKENDAAPRIRELEGQVLEIEQPVLDTGPRGEAGEVSAELGSGGAV